MPFQPFDRNPFQGAKINSDTDILLLREIDERFGITSALEGILQHSRNGSQIQHSCTDLLRQSVYQIAAGYEDFNDANELRKGPALRLALDKKTHMRQASHYGPLSQGVRVIYRMMDSATSPSATRRMTGGG